MTIHASTTIGGKIMKYLLSLMLLIATIDGSIGDIECPLGSVYYTISVPEGWNIAGAGCCGITASDSTNPAIGIIALNHLHQGFDMLPAYTTPEIYLENYMPQDFSKGEKQVTDMKILRYEDNQDLANAFASYAGLLASGKSMRCSFAVNGIQAIGSFTIVTSELMGYGTTINFLGGVYAPADQFEIEASKLIDIFKSIQLIPNYRNICTPPETCLSWQYKCRDKCCSEPCKENGYCD
jgi:hypothetical protein